MPFCVVPSSTNKTSRANGKTSNGASGKLAESDDKQVKLFYETFGRGDTKVIMIMGFAAAHGAWWPQIKPLSGTDVPNSRRKPKKSITGNSSSMATAAAAAAVAAAAPAVGSQECDTFPSKSSHDVTAAPPAMRMDERSGREENGDCTVSVTIESVEERRVVEEVADGGTHAEAFLRLEETEVTLRETCEAGNGEEPADAEEDEGDEFLTGREVCVFDNRGIGNSTCPTDRTAYTTDIMALDALHLADHLGWKHFHVVGHSMGGMIACKLAATAPHRVKSLALISVSGGGFDLLPRFDSRIFSVGVKMLKASTPELRAHVDLDTHFSREFMEEVSGGSSRRDLLHVEYVKTLSEPGAMQPPHAASGHFNACWTHKLSRGNIESICSARIPTAVIHGVDDIIAHVSLGERVASRLAEVARFIPLLGAHMVVRERPHDVNACLEELIETTEGGVPVEQWVGRSSDAKLPGSAREKHEKAKSESLAAQFRAMLWTLFLPMYLMICSLLSRPSSYQKVSIDGIPDSSSDTENATIDVESGNEQSPWLCCCCPPWGAGLLGNGGFRSRESGTAGWTGFTVSSAAASAGSAAASFPSQSRMYPSAGASARSPFLAPALPDKMVDCV